MNAKQTLGETKLMVCNQAGLHARAAAKLVLLTRSFQSTIRLRYGNRWANAASILEVMSLGIGPGAELSAVVIGRDVDAALPALQDLFDRGFDENESLVGSMRGRELEFCTET